MRISKQRHYSTMKRIDRRLMQFNNFIAYDQKVKRQAERNPDKYNDTVNMVLDLFPDLTLIERHYVLYRYVGDIFNLNTEEIDSRLKTAKDSIDYCGEFCYVCNNSVDEIGLCKECTAAAESIDKLNKASVFGVNLLMRVFPRGDWED